MDGLLSEHYPKPLLNQRLRNECLTYLSFIESQPGLKQLIDEIAFFRKERVGPDCSPGQNGTVHASEKGRMHKHPNEDQISIAALPAMNKAQLLKVWERTFPTPHPQSYGKS